MPNLKLTLLTGAALLAGMAGAANAATKVVYGGGASLPAPYWRQAMDCYGVSTPLVIKATPPSTQNITPFNYTGTPPQDCATQKYDAKKQVKYISTGSGTGIAAIFSHDTTKFGDTDPTVSGNQYFTSVNYALSETALGTTEVNAYNNGGTVQGVVVKAPGVTPGAGEYANPREKYGRLVQFPILIAPVTIAYDPVYKKVRAAGGGITEYRFNVAFERADNSGGLHLDAATYCKILNGQITNWNDPALQALNNGQSLKDPSDSGSFSVPLQLVGRNDSSGTTSLFTRHIANVCASTPGNAFANSTSTLPAALQGPVYDKNTANTPVSGEVLGKFTRADGNDGVAKYVDFTQNPTSTVGNTVVQGRLAYLGPDYVLPGVLSTGQNTFGLNTASLKNQAGVFVAPTGKSAALAFGSILPPDSDANGFYDGASTDPRDRANPQDWVEPASKDSVLANPAGDKSYPIVGTSNFLGYQCYAVKARAQVVGGMLSWYNSSKTVTDGKLGILGEAGFAPLPKAWNNAIRETFLKGATGLNLEISYNGAGQCTGSAITGG
jgi:ABC-type phosphate transport system substrate-binding protein